jgi:AraC family transcriptional activator of pobA
MRMISQLPAPVRQLPPAGVRHVTFEELLQFFGKKNDHYYVIDSRQLKIQTALFRPFQTNDISIIYVGEGEITARYDDTIYTLHPGTLMLKPPNKTLQVLRISKGAHFRLFGFMQHCAGTPILPAKHMEALLLMATREPVLLPDNDHKNIVELLLTLLQQKGKTPEKGTLYRESVAHIFSLLVLEVIGLFQRKKLDTLHSISRKEQLTVQFMQLVREHAKEQRSVQFYADRLFVTPKYLSKCVKEVTGKTCGAIIDEMVVAQAKTLLSNHALTIGQVADELHFSDQFFFSKFFKKHTGSSPYQYRTAV